MDHFYSAPLQLGVALNFLTEPPKKSLSRNKIIILFISKQEFALSLSKNFIRTVFYRIDAFHSNSSMLDTWNINYMKLAVLVGNIDNVEQTSRIS